MYDADELEWSISYMLSMHSLVVQEIEKSYGDRQILRGCSFFVGTNERVLRIKNLLRGAADGDSTTTTGILTSGVSAMGRQHGCVPRRCQRPSRQRLLPGAWTKGDGRPHSPLGPERGGRRARGMSRGAMISSARAARQVRC